MSKKLRTHPHQHDGTMHVFHVPADTDHAMSYKAVTADLESFKSLVGGWIEVIRSELIPELRCGCHMVMVVNEEGRLLGLPHNIRASAVYPFDSIVGDVFFIGEGPVKDQHGFSDIDFFGLPPEIHEWEGPGAPYPQQTIDAGADV